MTTDNGTTDDRRLFFEVSQDLLCVADFDGRFLQVNPAWEQHLGWTVEELTSNAWLEFLHPDDVEATLQVFRGLLNGAPSVGFENRYRCRDGSYRWLSWNAYPSIESKRILSVVRDVTEINRERLRAQSHNSTLTLLASGASLSTVLELIVQGVEAENPGVYCTILLLDREGKRLRMGAAPSLPDHFNQAVDGVPVGPQVGSCGTAVYHNKRVIAQDLEADSRWDAYRNITREVGLKSCWSEPIVGSDGKILGVFGNYRKHVSHPNEDELKTVSEAAKFAGLAIERQHAQESMLLARTTIDKATIAVYWIRPDATVADVNLTACDVLQYSREELLRMSIANFDPNFSWDRWGHHWEELREKKKLVFERKHQKKDGTIFDVEIRAHHIQFGDDELNFAFVHDITDRLRSEAALRKSHKQYQSIVETASEGVWMVDMHGMTTFVNARLCELLGLLAENIVGKPFAAFVDAEFQHMVQSVLFADHSLVNRSHDFRFIRSDGSDLWAIVSSTPLRNENQIVTGWLIMVTDITDRKRMEEKLVIAQQKAEDANRIKSEFVANMSHEIRTPMTAILGYAEILADQSNRTLSVDLQLQYLETIRRNGKHLLTIIDDVLDIAKIEAGKLSVEWIRTDPIQVVADVIELMQVKAEAKRLRLESAILSSVPQTIQSDPVRLRQILMNLVGNAIKFTEAGSVHIGVRFVPSNNPEMHFVVKDSGIGMRPEEMERLFGAFEQADASTKRRFGGSGLGLRISQSLAKILGGNISVESSIGRGSVFTASIATGTVDHVPIIDAEEIRRRFETNGALLPSYSRSTPESSHQSDAQPLRGMRILLAEDGLDNQRLIAFHLRRAGAELCVVENGKLALEALGLEANRELPADLPIDLILTDIQMPEMDGLELTRYLRSAGYNLPIIALTAHAMQPEAMKCLAVGCNEHLPKPIDRARLIKACVRWAPKPISVES